MGVILLDQGTDAQDMSAKISPKNGRRKSRRKKLNIDSNNDSGIIKKIIRPKGCFFVDIYIVIDCIRKFKEILKWKKYY